MNSAKRISAEKMKKHSPYHHPRTCSPNEAESESTIAGLLIPHDLLNAANIPIDSNLEITCANGVIVITRSRQAVKIPDDLSLLFRGLGIHPDIVRNVLEEGFIHED